MSVSWQQQQQQGHFSAINLRPREGIEAAAAAGASVGRRRRHRVNLVLTRRRRIENGLHCGHQSNILFCRKKSLMVWTAEKTVT
jgi:hypothetical protein